MQFLIALVVFIAISSLIYSLTLGREGINLQERIAGRRGITPEAAINDRPSTPAIGQVAFDLVRRYLPNQVLENIQVSLVRAGNPTSLQKLVLAWVVGIVVLPTLYAVLILSRSRSLDTFDTVSLIALPVMGFLLPRMWLQNKVKQRQKRILKALPDALDLITTSVEAGLGIDAAFARVAEKVQGPIAFEFRRILREMSLGRSRRDALLDFSHRVELEDVTIFINAVVQAEHTGVSLGQVLRIQSDQLRTRRRQRAEAAAYKAPVKMVIPLVLFIFPAMFIVILGPAAIQIAKSGL